MGGWIDIYYKEFAHAVVEEWQVQNLQGRLLGWGAREELLFESETSLFAEFPLAWEIRLCCIQAFN